MEPLDSLNRWSERLRDRARAGAFFRFTWKRFLGDRLFEAAGALSFTTVFALVPDCFDHAVAGFAFYRSRRRKLDPRLRELGQTRAGFARGSKFVFSQHCKASRDVGLSEEQVAAIPPGVTIALLPDDDAEQARYNLDLALAAVARGEDVYIRHVRRTPATIVTA